MVTVLEGNTRREIPLTYLPGNATRLRVKAVGDLAGTGGGAAS